MSKKSFFHKKTRLRERNRTARIIKYFLFVVLVATILGGLSFLSHSDWAKVRSVTISGNSLVSTKELEQIINDEGTPVFLGIFRSDNFILYPKQKIQKIITDRFKTIKKVDISFLSKNILEMKVLEREPSYLWCASPESPPAECFFMDESGYVFNKSPSFSGNVFFNYYGVLDQKDAAGKVFLSAERLKALKIFVQGVKTLGANPVGLVAHTDEDYLLLLSPSGKIIFNDKVDFLKTFESLDAIVKENYRKNKDDFFAKLDYIDLRLGFKAFFKTK